MIKMCSSSSVVTVSLCLLLCLPPCLSSGVTVKPGEDATLPCRGSADAEITVIKWIKPDLGSDLYVFYYRDNHQIEEYLHPSYRGRVKLKDPEMKDGDVSVVLKNINTNDAGRYKCFVGDKRSGLKFISSFYLRVQVAVNIRAGQSVSLPCRAPSNTEIVDVEWTRAGRELEYVLTYLDGTRVLDNQLPSYENRVELKDREMKDGDVSMILKEVTKDDSGTYECRVFLKKTKSKRGSTEPISIVHLEVHQSGDTENKGLHVGLGVGLPALLVVAVAVFIIFEKRRNRPHQADSKKAETDSAGTNESLVSH